MTITSQISQTGKTRPIVLKSFKIKVEILEASLSLPKIVRDRSVLRSSSPLKMLVNGLIFKISSFEIGCLYKTSFRHLKAI